MSTARGSDQCRSGGDDPGGPIQPGLEGFFAQAAPRGELAKLMAAFTRDFTATGTLAVNGTYTLQSATLENLFAEPKVEATFSIDQGVLNNVDLVVVGHHLVLLRWEYSETMPDPDNVTQHGVTRFRALINNP